MKVLMQKTGTESPVVVMKLHNGSGAKGLSYPVFLKRSTEREEPMNKTKSYKKQWKSPRKTGGSRMLGISTVADRVAQVVVKIYLEPKVESYFHKYSYGYRPGKSAIDVINITRQRCWKYDWVLEFDIKGLFDNIKHELLMKVINKHTDDAWVILYIQRWLKALFHMSDGTIREY